MSRTHVTKCPGCGRMNAVASVRGTTTCKPRSAETGADGDRVNARPSPPPASVSGS